MRYSITIERLAGSPGLLMSNGRQAIDVDSPLAKELKKHTSKRGTNVTDADRVAIRRLKCAGSLWLDQTETYPVIPATAIRAMIEASAKQSKEGGKVRSGLAVVGDATLEYDRESLGTTVDELSVKTQMTCGVVVQQRRIEATRARFPDWHCTFIVECDDEQVDAADLRRWIDVGGRRIGIGSWRPQKSGVHGTFTVTRLEPLAD